MQLGRVGLWTFHLDLLPASAAREAVAELEELGYSAVWLPEAVGREPFVNSACSSGPPSGSSWRPASPASGRRDAMTMAAGQLRSTRPSTAASSSGSA